MSADVANFPNAIRWPVNRLLWVLCGAVGLFAATIAIANGFIAADRAIPRDAFGQDFMAFYGAGELVRTGRAAAMYDLDALGQAQREIAARAGYALAGDVAPWWNPPFVALPFAPLAALLGFRAALLAWTLFGVACLVVAAALLARIVGEATPLRRHRWLAVAALVAAPPTLQSLGHGQNTPLSLLLLTCTVLAWRGHRPIVAGFACTLLAYKPQLAAVVGVALLVTLGWRVIVGAMVAGVPLLLATFRFVPDAIDAFLSDVPANLHRVQIEQPYLWHRHVTLNAFFRHALQGNAPGETATWITLISLAAIACVAVALVAIYLKQRRRLTNDPAALDRAIAAVVLATPLLVPFYFDYDLLLLIVPAVLIGRDALASTSSSSSRVERLRLIVGGVLFVWLMINPPLAQQTGVNLTVPILATLFALHAAVCFRRDAVQVADGRAPSSADPETADLRLAA